MAELDIDLIYGPSERDMRVQQLEEQRQREGSLEGLIADSERLKLSEAGRFLQKSLASVREEVSSANETLNPTDVRASRFAQMHVHLPTDYDSYFDEMCQQWKENAEDALEQGSTIRPMWLRRNAENTSEFSAVIDYLMPWTNGARFFATIDINSDGGHSEIQVLMPAEDGSGEPVVVSSEAYDLAALGRAIEYVETNVQPVASPTR